METQKLTKYKTWRLLISSFILLSATGFASASYPTGFSYYDLPTTDKTYKPNELIVRFSDVSPGDQLIDGPVIIGPLTQSAVRNTVADYLVAGSSVTKQYKKIIPGLGVVKLPDGMSVIDALIRFNQSDCILYAEPNYKIKLQYKPNDTLYDEQWALENTGQDHGLIGADIDANEAWDILTDPNNPYSDDVVIAVIDTGIDYAHPDLYDNMWKNPGETRQDDVVEPNDFNEVDDDNNRYVDDIYGYDFFDEGDNDPCDEHYHGTHVAGIIAAVGDNDRGIAGVCWDPSWNIRLMALKIFGDEAIIEDEEEYIAWLGSTIEAIEYAVDNGADVINASWSIGYNYSQSLYDAVEETHDASILFVAAAGNDDYPSAVYPAAYNLDNIISVMATDNSDTRSIFSNYGSGVDLGAPGEEIISTTPEEPTGPMEDEDVDVDPGYDYLSGTSMAAPHVAGACALMKIVKPDLRYDEIKALILRSVDPVLPGLCVSGGRLNLYTALNMIRGGVVVNTSQPGVPYYTIQSAIDNAEDGDDLIAQQGRSYLETVDFNGLRIRLFSGDISYSGDPANMIVDPHNTFISAFIERHRHGYSGPVVRFTNGEGSGTLLKGFTVLDGGLGIQCSSLSNSPSISHCIITDNSGFGIFFGNNSSTISDCTISSNGGGGVYCSYSNPDIIDCEISDNNGLCTGGIHCYHSDPNIDTCTITRNTNWDGGSGIRARNGSDPNIHNCTITDNITDLVGGGIYLDEGTHSSISNCTILRNEANEWGGGIFLNNVSPPITDCTISDCYSDWEGGGIYCYDGAEPDIKNCTITGNHAGYDGGAIYNNKSNPLIKNCLITDNKADSWDCGGIFCEDASPTITNCTFAGNSSNDFDGKGGALFCYGTSKPEVTNCIFSDNEDIAIYESGAESDPNMKFCLFYNNINGDYYDNDTESAYNFKDDPNAILSTMRHYDIGDANDSNNIGGNPMFVPGRLGNYYLSHFEAGQILDVNGVPVDPNINPDDATSPAVDAGSGDANDPNIEMHLYSTRADNYEDPNTGEKDLGLVDIGFHYNDPVQTTTYTLQTTAINGTISPPWGSSYTQYSQVLLTANSDDPCEYQFLNWHNTDDDARIDREGDGSVSDTQKNIVTMDSSKTVWAIYETRLIILRCSVENRTGTLVPISPEPVETLIRGQYKFYRGTVVTLQATPYNPSHRAIWTEDIDDLYSYEYTNIVTMTDGPHPIKHFHTDFEGNEYKEVIVRFYKPRELIVPDDYTNLQIAIDNANNHDIIIIAPSDDPYFSEFGYNIYNKAITITSMNPDDPDIVAQTVIEMHLPPDEGGWTSPGFDFYNVKPNTILNGLTIRGWRMWGGDGWDGDPDEGYWDGEPGGPWYGSGIRCYYNASPTIKNCVITNCVAWGGDGGDGAGGDEDHPDGGHGGWPGHAGGGGLACMRGSNPRVINCTFNDCHAIGGDGGDGGDGDEDFFGYGGRGGGWYYYGAPPMPYYWPSTYGYGVFDFYTWYTGHGGAVYADQDSSPTFKDCTFTDSSSEGGICGISGINWGIWRDEPQQSYKIDTFGGAVFIGGDPDYYYYPYHVGTSSAQFDNCTFINNMADPNIEPDTFDAFISYGGAVAVDEHQSPNFKNCTFNSNTASIGGAFYSEWATLTISDCNIISNTAVHGGGADLIGGSVTVERCIFSRNQASFAAVDPNLDPNNPPDAIGEGGGIFCFDSNALIIDCNINNNNTDTSGGGLYLGGDIPMTVKNSLITGNYAIRDGGGISIDWFSEVNILNCTIADNSVTAGGIDTGFGGGLYCSYNSYVNILNSIIWGNIGTTGAQLSIGTGYVYDPLPSVVDVNHSLIGPPSDVIDEIEPADELTINVTNDTDVLVETILGAGIEIVGTPQYTGADDASGTFEGGLAAGIGIESGIIMTSGDANLAEPPNTSDGATGDNNEPGDPDLNGLLQIGDANAEDANNTYDAAVLEFSFSSKGGNLFFNFVFASDEYNEFTNSSFNDVFGFFLDGQNIALIPGTTTPVAINNVNGGNPLGTDSANEHLFNNNDLSDGGPFYEIEYDGFTNVFTAQAFNIGSGTHTIKLAIADTTDYALDSAVFIEAGTFSDKPSFPPPVYIDDGCTLVGWDANAPDPCDPWSPDKHNLRLDNDPCFIGGYFLSQRLAGQDFNSPCWDSGSTDANDPVIGLDTYTTRTDSVTDDGIVDMGYHYLPFTVPQYELTIEPNDVNVIKPNIYDPNYDGFYNWYTTVNLKIDSNDYDPNTHQLSWTGTDNDDSGEPSNTVTMDRDKTVAVWLVKSRYDLTIKVDGGNGQLYAEWTEDDTTYTSQAPDTNSIKLGTVVELTAEPDEGYKVKSWTGTDDNDSLDRTNTVTIDSDKTVRVEFGRPATLHVPSKDYHTIQEAVSAADAGDIVVVYPGTYDGDIDLEGKEITLINANPDDPNVIAETIIDCGQDGRGFILNGGEDENTIINGFTIINGIGNGGGIFIGNGSSPTIMNMIIRDCTALADAQDPNNYDFVHGAGVYIDTGCNPTFINCDIINCSANGTGGGVFCYHYSSPVFRHCRFINNSASWGGGLFCEATSSATVIDCHFENNTASDGGGGLYGGLNTVIAVDESTFIGNSADDRGGAMLWIGEMEILDSNIVDNSAIRGGGMFCSYAPETTIVGCDISQNQAGQVDVDDPNGLLDGRGGGVFCFATPALIRDCNVSYNTANSSGGAIYLAGSSDSPQLSNCLITNNIAGRDGGGISNNWYTNLQISNCTIADNMVTGDGFDVGYGGGLYCSYNSYTDVIDSIIWGNLGNIGAKGSQIAIATGYEYDPRPSTVHITYSDIQDSNDPNAFGAKREALDLVFCIDSTGSMFDDIDAVKEAASDITKTISEEIPDFRIAVIDYKDFNEPDYGGPDDFPYLTILEFSTDNNEVVDAIDLLSASGGADWPESVYAALMHCIDHNMLEEALDGELYGADPNSKGPGDWRSGNVLRAIILMADAPPHDPEPFTEFVLQDIIDAATGEDPILIMPVLVGDDTEAADYLGDLANGTGGTVVRAETADEVVDAILDAISLISKISNPIFNDTNCVINWDPNSYSWDPNSHNIDEDPCFIAGYYLSQLDAYQPAESNCVDGGSTTANDPNLDPNLDTYTTRTDSVTDTGTVDMGYHYMPFTLPTYKLTIEANDVNVVEPNIHDPDYDGRFNWNSTVMLRVNSALYDPFLYQILWGGTNDNSVTGPTNFVTMDGEKTVTIRLVQSQYELIIEVDGGNGKLYAGWSEDNIPHVINAPSTGNIKFGTVVKLMAFPDDGYKVKGWKGTDDDNSLGKTNTVTLNSDKTVRVEFGRPVTITVPSDYPTIQEAISQSNASDIIVVYSGTYDGDIDLEGKEITLTSANPDDPNVVATTIIDCEQDGRGFIFSGGENKNTIINGFTIINGSVSAPNGGGGIFIDSDSSPTIMNTVIRDCSALADAEDPNIQGFGGGIYIDTNSSPEFINCDIINCSADGGGGVFCNTDSSPLFRHCSFSDNSADWGGGLLCEDMSSTTITDCDFENNTADDGGGLYSEPNSVVTIDESTFIENSASDYGGAMFWFGEMEILDSNFVDNSALNGGGMFCAYSTETAIVGCEIIQNQAGLAFDPNDPNDPNAAVDGRGGGIFCFAASALVRDCIINYNTANTSGGAIYLAGSSDSPQISNCLITNNLAGRDGGGISINWYADPIISNCTFVSNAAAGTFGEVGNTGFGGALYCSYESGPVAIDNIFWNNYGLKGSEIAVSNGFEYDPRPSTLTVTYSDIKPGALAIQVDDGCTLAGWNQLSSSWNANTHNINTDPLFVTGQLGKYYLSQTVAGQVQNSPCVDTGSDYASNVDMIRYTTSNDDMRDTGIVDMGYHYPLVEPCRFCDLAPVHDGIINFKDFTVLALSWLDEGCSDDNNWCQGADITNDTFVDFGDLILFVDCWLFEDILPPIPNPSEWETEPYSISSTSVGMTAKTSYDNWGWSVEYFFECVYGDCHDSGWLSSSTYTDSGLTSGAVHGYKVKARDELGNETEWSVVRYVGEEDTTPPAPEPYINTIEALGSNSITMTATIANDDSGVEYYFDCMTSGGHDSDWLEFAPGAEPNYTDTGLESDTTYYYRVTARDKSPAQNDTGWSDSVFATTTTTISEDDLAPTPDPMQWALVDANGFSGEPRLVHMSPYGLFDYWATMTAAIATDTAPEGIEPSDVEYKFICVTDGFESLSSGWQVSPAYSRQVGRNTIVTDWYVKARDTSPNNNTTAKSPTVRALAP